MKQANDTNGARLEERLRDWLRDGPDRLPGRTVDAILVHADEHPRRAGRLGLALRRLRVAVRNALAGTRRPVAVLASVAVLVVAVGLGAWMLRPAWVGPGSPLEGWVPATAVDECVLRRSPVPVDERRWADGRLECTYIASDPRQDGVRSVDLSSLSVPYGDPAAGTSLDEIYGRGTQRGDAGSWACVFTGEILGSQRIASSCRGRGELDGLELVIVGTSADGAGWTYRSWIEPATPGRVPATADVQPAPAQVVVPDLATGSETCTVMDPGLEERVDDAVHVRGERVRCEIASSDARIAGGLVLERSTERLDDGEVTTWGTARLTTAGGTWAGPFVGAWQPRLVAGSTISRAWLVREDGASGEIILREQGTPGAREVEAEIRP